LVERLNLIVGLRSDGNVNLQDAPQGREHRTSPKQATPLAFGEIGYEGWLGEVASAAVIG
jgi:hypothetical protein